MSCVVVFENYDSFIRVATHNRNGFQDSMRYTRYNKWTKKIYTVQMQRKQNKNNFRHSPLIFFSPIYMPTICRVFTNNISTTTEYTSVKTSKRILNVYTYDFHHVFGYIYNLPFLIRVCNMMCAWQILNNLRRVPLHRIACT